MYVLSLLIQKASCLPSRKRKGERKKDCPVKIVEECYTLQYFATISMYSKPSLVHLFHMLAFFFCFYLFFFFWVVYTICTKLPPQSFTVQLLFLCFWCLFPVSSVVPFRTLLSVHVKWGAVGQLDPLWRHYDMGVVFIVLGGSNFEWPCVAEHKFMPD